MQWPICFGNDAKSATFCIIIYFSVTRPGLFRRFVTVHYREHGGLHEHT